MPWQVVLELYKSFEESLLEEMKFNAVLNYLAVASTISEEAFDQFKELIEKQHYQDEETQEEATLEELQKLGIIINK